MPVLTNPKRERFAQELAAGKTADEAYVLAGNKQHRGNASRLSSNESIKSRVREILDVACEAVVIERSWLLGELHKIAAAPFGDEHVKVADKRKALVDIARIEGWVIEKHEHSGGVRITHEQALAQLK